MRGCSIFAGTRLAKLQQQAQQSLLTARIATTKPMICVHGQAGREAGRQGMVSHRCAEQPNMVRQNKLLPPEPTACSQSPAKFVCFPASIPACPTCTALLEEAVELAQAWLSGSLFNADQQ